jgi:alkylhydroperoxidase/carboxymuconolactone decarboxylase family protein YurZ
MVAETHEQKVARLIEKHVRDRNMDPTSIKNHYSVNHFGFELDPEYFDVRLTMGWGFFKDQPRHLDHMTRNMLISVLLAFRDRPGCYHQGKKGVMMGATYEQMLEAYEAGHIAGGGPVLINGMQALKRMWDEGIKPGCQAGPCTGKWVQLGPARLSTEKERKGDDGKAGETREERINRMLEAYYPDEVGGERVRKDLAFGARLDPDFVEGFARLAWGVFAEKRCFLDPVRREMAMLLILAFQGRREEVYIHTKKALKLGATMEQLLEAFEVGFTGGGSGVVFEGLHALRRIHEEGSHS